MSLSLATVLRQGASGLPLAGLMALCALSVGWLGFACLEPILPDGMAEAPEAAGGEAAVSIPPPPPRFVADALVAKPLFSPTRSPPPPPPPPAPPAPVAFVPPPPAEEPAPSYSLRGIVATPVTRKVLLRPADNAKPVWLAEGESSAEGWVLSRVDAESALLSKGAREIELRLKPKHAKKSQFAIR